MATEQITLPSKGYPYPKESPLSKGYVDMKYMTAVEEDLLTNPNNRKNGAMGLIDKLLEELIVTDKVKIDDLIEGDRTQLLIAARVLAYGSAYSFQMNSLENDTEVVTQTVELSKLEDVKVDFEQFTAGENVFKYTLLKSNTNIEFKLLTHGDIKSIYAECAVLEDLYKKSHDVTVRLRHQILSVNGDSSKGTIKKFVDEMLSMDTREFRKHYRRMMPDVDTTFTYTTDSYTEGGVNIPLSIVDMFFRE